MKQVFFIRALGVGGIALPNTHTHTLGVTGSVPAGQIHIQLISCKALAYSSPKIH